MTKLREQDAERRKLADLGPDFSEALARGLAVLNAFNEQALQMTLSDVARAVDLPKATTRRAIMTLQHLGYIEADGRLFRLAPSVLKLAAAYLSSNAISMILQPACERLAQICQESTSAAVFEHGEVVMIARALPAQALPLGVGIGFRVPAYCSALGRVLLSARSDADIDIYLAGAKIDQHTPHTITVIPALKAEILRVRETGYSYANQEAEYGYHSIAIPLRKFNGSIVAALHIGSRIERVSTDRMLGEFRERLEQTAQDLQPQLI
ncbi:MAG TPA: IclR family transcriptional regulator C-terminal domain-containing protein [Sphingobium sp.]